MLNYLLLDIVVGIFYAANYEWTSFDFIRAGNEHTIAFSLFKQNSVCVRFFTCEISVLIAKFSNKVSHIEHKESQ